MNLDNEHQWLLRSQKHERCQVLPAAEPANKIYSEHTYSGQTYGSSNKVDRELLNSIMSVQAAPSRQKLQGCVPRVLHKIKCKEEKPMKSEPGEEQRCRLIKMKKTTLECRESCRQKIKLQGNTRKWSQEPAGPLLRVGRVRHWIRRQSRGSQSTSIACGSFPVFVF